jgi:hypothetical protein
MDFRDIRRSRVRDTQGAGASQPLLRLSGPNTRDVALERDQEADPVVLASPEVARTAWRWLK